MAHHSRFPFDDMPEGLRDMFPDKSKDEYIHELLSPFGATGRFPQGQYTPQDEGEIAFGVAADKSQGKVIVNFGKPVAWFGMDREQALALAESLKQKADDLLDKER
ncbi:MAG TPA: hypothetical protein VGB17_06285 [Pyrinomonadaceae bacterium]|jgi:hypothetical protein